ncbi:hypothetical protein NE237_016091 [Protea cynaroides]|uniref:Uncharacterized protein n=1 Tax=Protea cynaroides TaxID=273540 RepID=A0A9Q0QRP5_9MAGN|nr:hypothetical protein NE237_016091 [Protea cynaroides]
MAESGVLPSYDKLHLCRRAFKRSNFRPSNAFSRICQRKHSYGVQKLFVQLSSCKPWELGAPTVKLSRGSQHFREFSLRRCFLGTLTNPESPMSLEWVPVVDQVLLMTSLVLAYMAGVVPSKKDNFGNGNSTAGNNVVPANSASSGSAAKNDERINSESAWDEVKTKLIGALSAIEHDGNSDNIAVEYEKCSPKRPLSLYAVDGGPRLRLICATLQQLEKEVNNISGKCAIITRNDWLDVSSEIIQKSSRPICLKWLEDELYLEGRKPEEALLSVMFEKLKDDDTILQNIKKSGKENLYADVLLFLRFGFRRGVCCYDYKLLSEHEVDILEDLVLTLADGIVGFYLELISVDGKLSSEMNSLGLTICSLSTRSLQKLRNEVALNQWLHQNMESIVLMYEDRFELCTLQVQFLKEQKSETGEFYWWKKLGLRISKPTLSPLSYVVISQLSISLKRTKELRALTGWRYYFSLFLEFSDITMPLVKAIFAKISSAISFFLVSLIGRSLGLIYTGIRQSLGWRFQMHVASLTNYLLFGGTGAFLIAWQQLQHQSKEALTGQFKMMSTASSLPTERFLSENHHPQHTKATHTSSSASTSKQFEAGEHEVPSGPNPISNRRGSS